MTHGEFIIEQWQHGQDKKKGPGFDRYAGDEGPYQIFESQLGKDPNAIVRKHYQATPKEMHLWIVKFVEELERGD